MSRDKQTGEARERARSWTPLHEDTLIDRICDPARTLTSVGKVQLALWIACVALLILVLSEGRDHAWAALAALLLILLIGAGVATASTQLWRAARVMHDESRLWFPKLSWPDGGSPTTFVAIGMLLVAVMAAMAYFRYHWLSTWAPGILLGALTIAVTVTVVDQALRANESRRLKALREPAMRQISEDLHDYLLTEANGLAVADPYRLPPEPVQSPIDWMDIFIDVAHEGESTSFQQRSRRADQLIANAEQLHSRLDRVRIRNGEVLDPEFCTSIDLMLPELERTKRWALEARLNVRDPYGALKEASSRTLRAVADVVESFDGCGGIIPDDLFADIWEKSSAYADRRRTALEMGQPCDSTSSGGPETSQQ